MINHIIAFILFSQVSLYASDSTFNDPSSNKGDALKEIEQMVRENKPLKELSNHIKLLPPQQDEELNKYLRFLKSYFSHEESSALFEQIDTYKALDAIEEKISLKKGGYGLDMLKFIPSSFRSCVQCCVGRIFAVNLLKKKVSHIGSGMLLPNSKYSEIVTCRHVMRAPKNEKLEDFKQLKFYFVRSVAFAPLGHENFDIKNANFRLLTGCLHPDAIIPFKNHDRVRHYIQSGGDQDELANQIFIRFLLEKANQKHSNLVREIKAPGDLCALDGTDTCSLKRPFDETYMNQHCSDVNFEINKELHSIPEDKEYYAIGFPRRDYLFKEFDEIDDLWLSQRLAPITLVLGDCNKEVFYPSEDFSRSKHFNYSARTSPGMSGGPVLMFNEESKKITLIGVIGSGAVWRSKYKMFTFIK